MSDTEVHMDPTEQYVEAWTKGETEKATEIFDKANEERGITDDRPGFDAAPTPDQPVKLKDEFLQGAVTELQSRSGGAELLQEWGGPTSQNFADNMAYAKDAVGKIMKENPAILEALNTVIERPDGSTYRMGDDPMWIKIAAQFGRQHSAVMGEPKLSERYTPPAQRSATTGGSAAKRELDQLMKANPPGSPQYKEKAVQDRIMQLHGMISGGQPMVGRGGRYA